MNVYWKCLPVFILSLFLQPCFAQVSEQQVLKEATKRWDADLLLERIKIEESYANSGEDEPTGLAVLLKPDDEFFEIYSKDTKEIAGYCMASSAPGRFENFDYFILYDSLLTVQQVKVWKYRSSYGGAVAGKRWLRQFSGYREGALTYGRDVQAISGATISGNSLVAEVERAGKVIRKVVTDQ